MTSAVLGPPAAARTDHVRRLPSLPPALVTAARRRIHTWLGDGMPDPARAHLTRDDRLRRYAYTSYGDADLHGCAELARCVRACDPPVRDLIGPHAKPGDLQIALRFPGQFGYPHVDGMADESRLDDPLVPTGVVTIYLSDVGPAGGALGTWPSLLPAVRRYGRRCAADPGHDRDRREFRTLMERAGGLPPDALTGPAGSAFLVAGNLPHCNLPNTGADIRVALFVRYYGRRHYPLGLDPPNGRDAITVLTDARPLSRCAR